MLGKIFSVMCATSFLFAAIEGRMNELSSAVIDGASRAITLSIALAGMMGLWCGVMRVLQKAGITRLVAKIISPILRIAFPESYKKGVACEELSANISANILGLGNAATPFGIKAMKALSDANGEKDRASDDMVTFVVMNTAPFSFMPTTLIALRAAAGSRNPFDIIVAVWICSALSMAAAIFFSRATRFFSK
ncbi:MAG: nucleoside recognition domain-containing protein [Eubacteriales bacterium]